MSSRAVPGWIRVGAGAIVLTTLITGCVAPNRVARRIVTPSDAASATAAAASTTSVEATATSTTSATPTSTATSANADMRAASPSGTTVRATDFTPTPSATPVAVPTPVGNQGARRPSANAASAGFAPPPYKATASAPNVAGITRIVSTKFGLDHYVDVLGIVNNEMEAPDHDGSYAVGWYSSFSRPGEPGNAMFSAHETWNHYQGPFYWMYTAEIGDRLSLDMANGQRYTYQVISMARYTVDTIPMGEILYPPNRPQSEEWITLITCGGSIVYGGNGFGDYNDRDIVVMKRVS